MNLDNLTDEELDAWRANPVTETMRAVLSRAYEAQKDAALQAYWGGNPWPQEDLKALRRTRDVVEDFFESSADDVRATMEQFDEYKRHQAD